MNILSINSNLSYFLSKMMGDILELKEGAPIEVHSGLIKMINFPFNDQERDLAIIKKIFHAGVQINTRDFYFREREELNKVLEVYRQSNVIPTIHQENDAQPLNEKKQFLKEIKNNIEFTESIWGNNICVHLPVNTQNTIEEVINNLTKKELISALKEHPDVSLDLENNHHKSFFGNLYHCSEFKQRLDDKLDDLGYSSLKKNFNFTFDYGHFVTQSYFCHYKKDEMLEDFFRESGKYIKTFHLHNNDGIHKDQHLIIGKIPEDGGNGIGKIGNKDIIIKNLLETQELLLNKFPILDWKNKTNSNLVIEIDCYYTKEDIIKCAKILSKIV